MWQSGLFNFLVIVISCKFHFLTSLLYLYYIARPVLLFTDNNFLLLYEQCVLLLHGPCATYIYFLFVQSCCRGIKFGCCTL